jgi:hypothetical protein
LQRLQQVTRFAGAFDPPLLSGVTWSRLNVAPSSIVAPQYAQARPSRK